MTEIEAVSKNIQRLENAVIRAAVNRYYLSDRAPAEMTSEELDAELQKRVSELIDALPALPVTKR